MKRTMIGAGVMLAVALLIYFVRCPGPDSIPIGGGAKLDEDMKKGLMLLEVARKACLVGIKTSASAEVETKLEDLALKASAGISREEISGALDFIDQQLKKAENDEIRKCLDEHMGEIKACLKGDCDSWRAEFLPMIELQFAMTPEASDPAVDPKTLIIALKGFTDERRIAQELDLLFKRPVPYPSKGEQLEGEVARKVWDTNTTTALAAVFCLSRTGNRPNAQGFARLDCVEGAICSMNRMDPGWLAICGTSPPIGHWILDALLPVAQADPADVIWRVPSLQTFEERYASQDPRDRLTSGYTRFEIVSTSLGREANSYIYSVVVNGRSVRFDGVRPESAPEALRPDGSLTLTFGLQNMDFAGANDGCEAIEVTIQPQQRGESVGEPVVLRRSYVALRNDPPLDIAVGSARFTWTARYQRPPQGYDYELFLASNRFSASADSRANAAKRIRTMKAALDGAGLEFQGLPLVAVIRPKLNQNSFGLAAGVLERTGQIRFTFTEADVEDLRREIEQARQANAALRNLLGGGLFIDQIGGTGTNPADACPSTA